MSRDNEEANGDLTGDMEVRELDRSGNVQRRWLQSSTGELSPVSQHISNATTLNLHLIDQTRFSPTVSQLGFS